jgi:flavorubredoxin
MDTVESAFRDEWLSNVEAALGGRKPDYLVVQHMEPDHSGNVEAFLAKYADCTVICSAKAVPLFKRFFESDYESRIKVVGEGDTLPLGKHTLQFLLAPMVHWPEVMVTYDQHDKILFSADAFGKFGALSKEDENDEGWACEARRYYFNICGKYGNMVQGLLKKIAKLEVSTICPLHGPVLSDDLGYYIGLYDTWSKYEAETEGVFIAFCSLHGNTGKAANILADALREKGVKVSVADLSRDDLHEAVEDAFRYDRMVLAAPTYDGGLMPIMEDFINHLRIKAYQNRKVAFIENGSWAPVSGKKMREAMEAMKNITIVDPLVTVESTVKPATIEKLKELAGALA